ncbi:MAG: hypothetical protein IJ570_02235 [Prevotella sp.]|nr:hypothetical protein [Prevotella sp.]
MTRIISISLNVPESYQVDTLTRQLTEYGERLIARSTQTAKPRRRSSRDFLKGLSIPKEATDRQLVDEYLEEKYGL